MTNGKYCMYLHMYITNRGSVFWIWNHELSTLFRERGKGRDSLEYFQPVEKSISYIDERETKQEGRMKYGNMYKTSSGKRLVRVYFFYLFLF